MKSKLVAKKKSLVVTELVSSGHTHPISKDVYITLPYARQANLKKKDIATTAGSLLKAGVKPSKIVPQLRSLGSDPINVRDLQHLR